MYIFVCAMAIAGTSVAASLKNKGTTKLITCVIYFFRKNLLKTTDRRLTQAKNLFVETIDRRLSYFKSLFL